MSFEDKIDENMNNGIEKMVMEIYGIDKKSLIDIQKEIYRRDIVGSFENLVLSGASVKGIFWHEIREIEDMLPEEVVNHRLINYSNTKRLEMENIDRDSFFNIGGESGNNDLGFDYSPIEKNIDVRKAESKKEKFLADMRDAALSLANMEVNKSNIKVDLYSITCMTTNIGMMKGRGEYLRPYKEKIKKEEKLRKNTPTDSQLAEEWGYESPSEI